MNIVIAGLHGPLLRLGPRKRSPLSPLMDGPVVIQCQVWNKMRVSRLN